MSKLGRPKTVKRGTMLKSERATVANTTSTRELSVEELARQVNIADKFKAAEEKKLAVALLDRYLQDFVIESVSDINTLKEIIYFEIVQFRIQDKLNDMYTDDTKRVDFSTLDVIHKNSEVIIKLKATLGLKSDLEKLDDFSALENLKRRFKKWREENQGSRYIKCPHCIKPVLLKIRTEAWEAQQHPFFQDNFLCNRPLLESLGKTILIDRDFIARVFNCSPDYIDWILKNMKNSPLLVNNQPPVIEEVKEAANEEIKEPINGTDTTDTAPSTGPDVRPADDHGDSNPVSG